MIEADLMRQAMENFAHEMTKKDEMIATQSERIIELSARLAAVKDRADGLEAEIADKDEEIKLVSEQRDSMAEKLEKAGGELAAKSEECQRLKGFHESCEKLRGELAEEIKYREAAKFRAEEAVLKFLEGEYLEGRGVPPIAGWKSCFEHLIRKARALTVAAPSAEPKDAIPPNCSCQESSPARLVVHRNDGPCYVRERRDPWCDNCDLHFEAHDGPGRKCPTGGKEYHGPAEPKKETM